MSESEGECRPVDVGEMLSAAMAVCKTATNLDQKSKITCVDSYEKYGMLGPVAILLVHHLH